MIDDSVSVAVYIIAAYAFSGVAILALIAWLIGSGRAHKKAISRLEGERLKYDDNNHE